MDSVAEGIFYADDLPDRDPIGYAVLVEYARTRLAWVDRDALDCLRGLTVEPLRCGYSGPCGAPPNELRGAVVCFNAPFDLSRMAWQAGETRTYKPSERTDPFEGGFSFTLFSYNRDGAVADEADRAIRHVLPRGRRERVGAASVGHLVLDSRVRPTDQAIQLPAARVRAPSRTLHR